MPTKKRLTVNHDLVQPPTDHYAMQVLKTLGNLPLENFRFLVSALVIGATGLGSVWLLDSLVPLFATQTALALFYGLQCRQG